MCVPFPLIRDVTRCSSLRVSDDPYRKHGATKLAVTRLVDLKATIRENDSCAIVGAAQICPKRVARGHFTST